MCLRSTLLKIYNGDGNVQGLQCTATASNEHTLSLSHASAGQRLDCVAACVTSEA
jgi:hypothetical protein